MEQIPNWKTVWNCHILDRLYWVHQDHILDEPIMSIEVHERIISLNGYEYVTDTSCKKWHQNYTYYLNRCDAEHELTLKQ